MVLLDARGDSRRAWGALAGVMATLAFFTKAAAAFYVGALGLLASLRVLRRRAGTSLRLKAEAGTLKIWSFRL